MRIIWEILFQKRFFQQPGRKTIGWEVLAAINLCRNLLKQKNQQAFQIPGDILRVNHLKLFYALFYTLCYSLLTTIRKSFRGSNPRRATRTTR